MEQYCQHCVVMWHGKSDTRWMLLCKNTTRGPKFGWDIVNSFSTDHYILKQIYYTRKMSICYGAAQRCHNLFCRIHENVFKLYLWCVDDFLTDWLDNFYIKRQGLQVLAKTLPISLRFNVSPVIRLLQVGAFSASQSPVAFWLLGRKR